VSRMYVPMLRLENRPLAISLSPFLKNKFFVLFWGIWAPSNGPKKVLKSPQVGGMYVPMLRLENKPLTKLIGPFL
jgi:hypothetical protein